jgi:hypothetical protein
MGSTPAPSPSRGTQMHEPKLRDHVPKKIASSLDSPLRSAVRRVRIPVGAFAALSLLPLGIAGCQTTGPSSFTVPAGVPRQIGFFATVNEDCSSVGDVLVRITRAPEHGSADVRSAPGHAIFPESNPRHRCDAGTVPGQQVWYTPAPGFVGRDQVDVETIFPNGVDARQSLSLLVR